MAKFRVNGNTTISITDASAARAMAAYVEELSGFGKAFAMLYILQLNGTAPTFAVGLQEAARFTLRGKYDDTATTGPHVVFTGLLGDATARAFSFSPDGTKTLSGNCRLVRYEVTARHGEMVMYEA